MQLTIILNILGYDISFGVGADVEKSEPRTVVLADREVTVVESKGDIQRTVGFGRNEDEDD